MISPEEKKKVIEDMIKMSYQKKEPIELQRELHAFLLRDTNGGKLYKYRSFDKKDILLRIFKKGPCIVRRPMHLMIHLIVKLE